MVKNSIFLKKGWNLVSIHGYSVKELLDFANQIIKIYEFDEKYIDITNKSNYTLIPEKGYWIKCIENVEIPKYESIKLKNNWLLMEKYDHDKNAFTQGFEFYNNKLYEGTGLYGKSSIRKVDLKTGEVIKKKYIDNQYFGEGITIWEDKLLQLTWKKRIGFVYNLDSFEKLSTFNINTTTSQGWGLTHSKDHLILSDGSSYLHFLDPNTMKEVKKIQVIDKNNKPVDRINELEYIDGLLFANIWITYSIICINPNNGKILQTFDFSNLLDEDRVGNEDVLNGIAFNENINEMYITGKFWSKVYKIKIN